ncbi:MAG: DUF1569 domain-containing protein [Cyclonatronaceae bacterium]
MPQANTSSQLTTLVNTLGNLTPDTQPLWGGMTAQHMVEHLTSALMLSNGDISIGQNTEENKIPAMRAFLMSDRPMPRNFRSPANGDGLPRLKHTDLEKAVAALTKALARFHQYHEKNPGAKPVNPVFGPLSYEEWIQFHQKHFQHHLTQFGLITN